MKVCIRADGNAEIAMGHVMRCLSVADAMRDLGAEVTFITAGEDTKKLITDRGYEDLVLHTDFREMEGELPILLPALEARGAGLLLVDSYFVTREYFRKLKGKIRTVYLDDFASTAYEVDGVINYNVYGDTAFYRKLYQKQKVHRPDQILMGSVYAPLRKEFQRPVLRREETPVKRLLLSTGGGDLAGAAKKICLRLQQEMNRGKHAGLHVVILCGPFSPDREWIHELTAWDPRFLVRENVTRMSELMDCCDAAITASGSTVYELCSRRLPFVTFIFAENQRQMAQWLDVHTDMKCAGNIVEDPEPVLDRLMERLKMLEEDAMLRKAIRLQQEQITDGFGAVKLAGELLRG